MFFEIRRGAESEETREAVTRRAVCARGERARTNTAGRHDGRLGTWSFLLLVTVLVSSIGVPAFAREAGKNVVAVYAGSNVPMWTNEIATRFSKETGIPTQIFGAPLPAAAVAATGKHPEFNVALIAEYSAPLLAKKGLIKLFDPSDLPGLKEIPKKFWPMTPTGKVMGMPIYFGIFGIAYNTKLAKASDFTSWSDLLAPKWKGKISVTAPNFMAVYDLQLYSKIFGSEAAGYEFIRKLLPQSLNIYTSMASVESQLGSGEVAAVPYYGQEIALMRSNGDRSVAFTVPKQGGLILPYLVVVPSGAKNVNDAMALLKALVQPTYQLIFAKQMHVWPMNPSVQLPSNLAESMGVISEAMKNNYEPNWWPVGLNIVSNTAKLQKLFEESR